MVVHLDLEEGIKNGMTVTVVPKEMNLDSKKIFQPSNITFFPKSQKKVKFKLLELRKNCFI
jgi:hypothetical protein